MKFICIKRENNILPKYFYNLVSNKIKSMVEHAKLIIFDSDGVLLEGGVQLPYAVEIVNYLKQLGKIVVVFSNNSTVHPIKMHEKFANLGFKIDYVITSSMLAVEYCKKENINSVYVIGENGLLSILKENKISDTDVNPQAVIVGMDRALTYDKLAIATRLIRAGMRFIATNPDKSFPTPRGLEPGAGSIIAALTASTDKLPEIVLGKPAIWGYNFILQMYSISSIEALMIGDRYETDILGAIQAKIPAFVVATGISSNRKEPGVYENYPQVPVISNFKELRQILE